MYGDTSIAYMGDSGATGLTIAQDPVKILLVGALIIVGILSLGYIFKR